MEGNDTVICLVVHVYSIIWQHKRIYTSDSTVG